MQIIERLGKPRSWLVFATACLVGLVLGGACVGLYFAGFELAGRIGMLVGAACWAVAAASCINYFAGQATGRHRDLRGKRWSELPW